MHPEEPTTQQTAAENMGVRTPHTEAYEPAEHSDWLDEEPEELPRRPRRKLVAPVPLTLLAVLLVACGFIGGVLVEKGETSLSSSTGSAASGLSSRLAALRGSSAAATGGGAAGGFFGRSGGGASGAGATVGQVAFVSGSTLYVTTAEGNTVKVTTSKASIVTKTVKAHVKAIHPGETVIVTGSSGPGGAVSAESIRVSEAGAGGGGGLARLFGGGGAARGSGGKGGGPALFGG